jgi:hypothetical protein
MSATKYIVTRLFTSGNLAGLTHTEVTTIARVVGSVVQKPIGGSSYRIVSCKVAR